MSTLDALNATRHCLQISSGRPLTVACYSGGSFFLPKASRAFFRRPRTPFATRSDACPACSATCTETDFSSFEAECSQARADVSTLAGFSSSGLCGWPSVAAATRSSTTRSMSIVASSMPHLPLLPQPGDARAPVVFGHLPEVVPGAAGRPPRSSVRPIRLRRPCRARYRRHDNTFRPGPRTGAGGPASGRCCPARWDRPETVRISPAGRTVPVRRRGSGRGNCRPGRRP